MHDFDHDRAFLKFVATFSPSPVAGEKVVKRITMTSVKGLRQLGSFDDATEEVLATGLNFLLIKAPGHSLAMVSAETAMEKASEIQRITFVERKGQEVRTIKRLI